MSGDRLPRRRWRRTIAGLAAVMLLVLGLVQAQATPRTEPLAAHADRFLGSVLAAQIDPLFTNYWNQVTPEDAGKWLSVEAQRGVFTWMVLDVIVDYARAHGLERVDPAVIRANLDALAILGLPIYVSELDLESSDDDEQLAMYQRVFPVLWEHPAVAGVTLWGYRAGRIWKSNAFLIDWFDEERPALQWLAAYVRGEVGD